MSFIWQSPRSKRSIAAPNFLNRAQIEDLLKRFLDQECGVRQRPVVLDLGCGHCEYLELLPVGSHYIPLDAFVFNPGGVVANGASLPLKKHSCDIIICIQVLEHVEDPSMVIAEMGRVLKPGGVLLLSTHGTMFYHPTPNDYWRWTQEGLNKLLRDNCLVDEVTLVPVGTTITTFGFLVSWYLWLIFVGISNRLPEPIKRLWITTTRMIIATVNVMTLLMQNRVRWLADPLSSNTLFLSFFIRAIRTKD